MPQNSKNPNKQIKRFKYFQFFTYLKQAASEALKALLDEYEKVGGYLKKPSYADFKAHFHSDTRLTDALKFYDMEKFFNVKLEKFQKELKDGDC